MYFDSAKLERAETRPVVFEQTRADSRELGSMKVVEVPARNHENSVQFARASQFESSVCLVRIEQLGSTRIIPTLR